MAKQTDRLIDTESKTLVSAYVSQTKRLEVECVGLRVSAVKSDQLHRAFEGIFRAATTLKFKCLGGFCVRNSRMVEHSGIEPLTSCMPCRRSPS